MRRYAHAGELAHGLDREEAPRQNRQDQGLPTLAPKVLQLLATLLCLASFKKAFTWFSGILVTDVFVFFFIKRSHFLLDIAENLEK